MLKIKPVEALKILKAVADKQYNNDGLDAANDYTIGYLEGFKAAAEVAIELVEGVNTCQTEQK